MQASKRFLVAAKAQRTTSRDTEKTHRKIYMRLKTGLATMAVRTDAHRAGPKIDAARETHFA
jgi:hypothetical protein